MAVSDLVDNHHDEHASPRPVVTHFAASVASLPASGGSVRLSATVKNGSKCAFTSTPALKGLPASAADCVAVDWEGNALTGTG